MVMHNQLYPLCLQQNAPYTEFYVYKDQVPADLETSKKFDIQFFVYRDQGLANLETSSMYV